jgi:low affinity Fe/Cu permease
VTESQRQPRRRSSRLIDRVTDVLGHESTFVAVVVLDLLVLVLIVVVGMGDEAVLSTTSVVLSLLTLILVCAIQHTSSRESRALNLKLDELIRVSGARNELIGAEDESHRQLDVRREQLREEELGLS